MQFLILSLLGLGVASAFWGGKDGEIAEAETDSEENTESQPGAPIVPLGEIFGDGENASEYLPADLIIARHGATEIGSHESDMMHAAFGGICHGGDGDDVISVRHEGIAYGETGDDLFDISGGSTVDGGEGDDLFLVDLEDSGSNELTGGVGSDVFHISPTDGVSHLEDQMTTITDFTPGDDCLVISARVENSMLRGFEIRPSEDGQFVDVILEIESQSSSEDTPAYHVIRLEGLSEFSEEDVQITLDDLEPPGPGSPFEQPTISPLTAEILAGSSDPDFLQIDNQNTNALFQTGHGADTVESGAGFARGTLGEGDDVFRGSIGECWVAGDGGDDSLSAAEGSVARLDGGTGNDSLAAETDDQSDSLIGGEGDDTLVGSIGDFMDAGGGVDQVVLNVSPESLGQEPATITGLGNNSDAPQQEQGAAANETLVLNISEDIPGELSFSNVTIANGHSVEIIGTNVFLGEQHIAYIHEYGGEDGIGWHHSDPRLVVNRV